MWIESTTVHPVPHPEPRSTVWRTCSSAPVRARALGTELGNRISAAGCVVSVDGSQGADLLTRIGIGYRQCDTVRTRFLGGAGADRLVGANQTNDTLIGGTGRDVAIGSRGTDTCRAEVTRSCE